MWPQYNRRLRDVIAAMTDEQLATRPAPDRWPIWATVGHTAGMRVYWLCDLLGQPGAETTPFANAGGYGWEDDLGHPRGATELAAALDSTFALVERALDTWTPDMLADEFHRAPGTATRSTSAARSCSGCSATTRITAGSCRRRSGSRACRRSTSGPARTSWRRRNVTPAGSHPRQTADMAGSPERREPGGQRRPGSAWPRRSRSCARPCRRSMP